MKTLQRNLEGFFYNNQPHGLHQLTQRRLAFASLSPPPGLRGGVERSETEGVSIFSLNAHERE